MAQSAWTLTSRSDRTYVEQLRITPDLVGGPASGYHVHKYRLAGGPSDGVDVVHVDNGRLSFDLLPTRGMSIWKAWIDGQELGWNSPVRGPVHPSLVPLADPGGLGWLDGFDELLVRCGLESNGAPEFDAQGQLRYGLHGRIGNKPAHQLDVQVDGQSGTITIQGIVDEIRFHFFKLRMYTTVTTRVGQAGWEIRDVVENLSASPTQIQMLYHINFGSPLLGPGAKVVAPVGTLVPRTPRAVEGLAEWASYPAPQPGAEEQVYFFEMQSDDQQNTAVLLHNAAGDRGVSVHYNTRQLPCFTLWKNPTAEPDGYVTGLEPATNYPNPRSFESQHGRVIPLEPGKTCTFDLGVQFHQTSGDLEQTMQRIEGLRRTDATVHATPQPQWCAGA